MQFHTRELFGGAMTVEVPEKYYDVSDVRQVPDTQEVFQEREGIHSLIFDILEHVDNIADPIEAAKFHLEDYVDGDGDLKVWKTEQVKMSRVSAENDDSAINLLATTPPKDDKQTAIWLLLIRLKKHSTDLLITFNLHDVSTGDAAEYDDLFKDSASAVFKDGKTIFQQVVDTFEIKDYKLFHPEDA